jgi:hypothetical protein
MAKSSYAVALLFAGWSAGASADPPPTGLLTADEAMKHYHDTFNVRPEAHCPEKGTATEDDIVVCGRTHAPSYRLPLPIEREPGEIVRHAGDAGGGIAAMGAGGCQRACEQPVQVNVMQVIFAAPKVLRHILGKDD